MFAGKDVRAMICRYTSCFVFVAPALSLGMQAQRVQTVGPEVGFIRSLAIDPTTPQTLYAGTSGDGVIKSTDGGTNWNAFNTGSKEMKGMSRDTNPSRVSN